MHETEKHLTMAQAARISPGQPSPNCVWRWCRHGVKSRSGERVRLRHIRIGGVIFTTAEWVQEFGQRLAEADVHHFSLADRDYTVPQPSRSQPFTDKQRQTHLEQVNRELAEAGI